MKSDLVVRPGGFEGSWRRTERRRNLAPLQFPHQDCFAALAMTTPHVHTDEGLVVCLSGFDERSSFTTVMPAQAGSQGS